MFMLGELSGFGAIDRPYLTVIAEVGGELFESYYPASIPSVVNVGDLAISYAGADNFSMTLEPGSGNYYAILTLLQADSGEMNGPTIFFRSTGGPIISVSAFDADAQTTSGNPAAQTVTSGSGVSPLIAVGAGNNGTAADMSPTPDERAEDTVFGVPLSSIFAKIYNSVPSNVTVDTSDQGDSNYIGSFYLQVS